MEEAAVQQEKGIEASWEEGHDGGKTEWKNERSLSSLLKHSCFLCWSSPRDSDVMETDERVVTKATEIRELENVVTLENLELQEQQSDRKELEETLVKLDKHKEKLLQQIKITRQLCYEESQQILSLQAEEVQKESQVEEYEKELARARWRLRKLREEVKQAKKRVEEAGERNTPLQDSIRQSYEEILQEENTLCSLSGGAVTPQSQLEESISPADTTDEDPLPLKPWGRSQSLPAYADLIMAGCESSFCNNLTDTREEADDSGTSSPKMETSDLEDEPEEGNQNNTVDKENESKNGQGSQIQLDFYQADPFSHCQSEDDLFNQDLFIKTDSSGAFPADPFKGSDPFAADALYPDGNEKNIADEADASLSCAENKASTGTQCFESEFPDEDSDIEISYSREDLDAAGVSDDTHGFKPIQSSTEETVLESVAWRSQGQYSVESDPNGYELDLGAISPPSDIEELSLASLPEPCAAEATTGLQKGSGVAVTGFSDDVLLESDWPVHCAKVETLSQDVSCSQETEWLSTLEEKPQQPATPQNSLESQKRNDSIISDQDKELSLDMSYEHVSKASFDPYGFKLSPEHSSHQLLDPDDVELSPEVSAADLSFDNGPSSSLAAELKLDPYGFDIISSQMGRDSDPYGFKLSPEGQNDEVLDDHEEIDHCNYDKLEGVEPCNSDGQERLQPSIYENKEVLEQYSNLDFFHNENQEMSKSSSIDSQGVLESVEYGMNLEEPPCYLTEELPSPPDCDNQEVLNPENYNQEVLNSHHHYLEALLGSCCLESPENLELSSNDNQEHIDVDNHVNQEVPDLTCHDDMTLLDVGSSENQEVPDFTSHDIQEPFENMENQEVLDLTHCETEEPADAKNHESEEVLDFTYFDTQEKLDARNSENQEVLEFTHHETQEPLHAGNSENQELLEFTHDDTQEPLDVRNTGNQEVPEFTHHETQEPLYDRNSGNQEVVDLSHHETQEPLNIRNIRNQEVLDFTHHEMQEPLDVRESENQEVLDFTHHDRQEKLDLNSQEMVDLLSMDIPEANNNNKQCILDMEKKASSSDSDASSDICNYPPTTDLLDLDFSNTSIYTSSVTNNTCPGDQSVIQDHAAFSISNNPLEGDISSAFGAGGYISCPDVADDLEPLNNTQVNSRVEPEPPVRPVRPPRPSLRAKEKGQSQTQGIDLK